MVAETDRKHALFVGPPMFGHITPLMELAKKLTTHNFHITFAVSAAKAEEIVDRGYLPERFRSSIDIYPLHDGLPSDIDTHTDTSHFEEMQAPMEAPLGELLENMPTSWDENAALKNGPDRNGKGSLSNILPVDLVVCCATMYQPPTVCSQRGIPCFLVHTGSPFFLSMMRGLDFRLLPTITDEAYSDPTAPSKPAGIPIGMLDHFVKLQTIYGVGDTSPLHSGIIANGFDGMDPELWKVLENMPKDFIHSLHFIGPMLQAEDKLPATGKKAILAEKVAEWLDRQENGSVIYLSFGSMVFPQPHELLTLGRALLALGKPFIFSLRAEQQVHLPEIIQEKTAEQFETPYAPYLVIPWAQQQRILAHPATKVFLSHCGWNSTLEALWYGKPVVAWTLFADQPINADYLVDLGMAVRIQLTSLRTTKVTTEAELLSAFNKVGGWSAGARDDESCFEKAQQMALKAKQAMAPNGSSVKNFQKLLTLFRS
ncbi:putative UDP-glycosyltransferase 84B1 [Hypsibius exemplaris]|uniref:UDP-glycosyltransferase 84B1 n=1 Tax=Hypsibius exemplaris TaxID=2072580 RepID=A0A1W0WR15_HYPEX|nr:putative UDP-glycosyltransferase 84B1 [Hypsibius exemplaris]